MMPSTTKFGSSKDDGPSRDEMKENIQNQLNVLDTNTEHCEQADLRVAFLTGNFGVDSSDKGTPAYEEKVKEDIFEEDEVEEDIFEEDEIEEDIFEEDEIEEDIFEEDEVKEEVEEDEAIQNAPVFTLSEHVFFKIMDYLPVKDCIKMERVCKLWNDRSLKHWSTRKYLDVADLGAGHFAKRLSDSHMASRFKRKCPRIKTLSLTNPVGRCVGPKSLSAIADGMVNLIALEIFYTPFTYPGLMEIGLRCPNLQTLIIDGSNWVPDVSSYLVSFDVSFGAVLKTMGNLRRMEVTYCTDTFGTCFQYLSTDRSPPMISVSIEECQMLTDEGVYHIMKCPSLTRLRLCNQYGFLRLTDKSLSYIAEGSDPTVPSKLECLEIYGPFNEAATCFGVGELRKCNALKKLNLTNTNIICDDSLAEISNGCTNIEKLYVSHCIADSPSYSGTGLLNIANNCKKLTYLNINMQFWIPESTILAFAAQGRLTMFSACCNDKITETGLKALLSECTDMTEINVAMCPNIDFRTIAHLSCDRDLALHEKDQTVIIGDPNTGVWRCKWPDKKKFIIAKVETVTFNSLFPLPPPPERQVFAKEACRHTSLNG